MEAFRKKIKRKEPKEKKSEPPAPAIEDFPAPAPAPVVARPKITVHLEPTAMEMQDMSQKQQEADAMNTFRQRISTYRNSQARYRNPNAMAPGFDYANWKPYGKVRYRNQEAEYQRFAENLAPYVYSVVESACLGVEERRWAAMTQQHPEELAAMESLAASRQISRAASRDRLAP